MKAVEYTGHDGTRYRWVHHGSHVKREYWGATDDKWYLAGYVDVADIPADREALDRLLAMTPEDETPAATAAGPDEARAELAALKDAIGSLGSLSDQNATMRRALEDARNTIDDIGMGTVLGMALWDGVCKALSSPAPARLERREG